jgi:hypothetical protein
MKNTENFVLLTVLGTVALVGVLLMINTVGNYDNVGQAYAAESISLDMTSEEEYLIYGKQIALEYVDGNIIALNIDGVLIKVPSGEKLTYKGIGIFSYGGFEIDKANKIYFANVDFYN